MTPNPGQPFIFFLTLDDALPSSFYTFNAIFKEYGFVVIPVRVDQLQLLIHATEQAQVMVISSVLDMREMKLFNQKVRGILKFVLKSRRMTYIQLSSFSKLDESKTYSLLKNYYFIKYPVDARVFAEKVAGFYTVKSEQSSRWPGGKRAGLGSVV